MFNILIPLAGSGSRFANCGYDAPKPLINVLGEPLIVRSIQSLEPLEGSTIYIGYQTGLDVYQFASRVKRDLEFDNIRFIPIDCPTRGAAETVLLMLDSVEDLSVPSIVLDGDNLYGETVLTDFRHHLGNCIFYFKDYDDIPVYSYITIHDPHSIDCNGLDIRRVADIREKQKISDYACVGAYGFDSGTKLHEYCLRVIRAGITTKGEFYLSTVIAEMLNSNETIQAFEAQYWHCLGTPVQLQIWAETNSWHGDPKRFIFDLDNTLVTYPDVPGDYSTCRPIQRVIDYLKYLKYEGHYIIIYTARRMRTHNGNVDAVIADIGEITRKQLAEFYIPYDELVFGKPWGHFYIDDLSVTPFRDLTKQIGCYPPTKIAPRTRHRVEYYNNSVRKFASTERIASEVYWYQNIPENLRRYAPELIDYDVNFIELERIHGIPLSYLLLSGSLTAELMQRVLEVLHEFHQIHKHRAVPITNPYLPKLFERLRRLSTDDRVDCEPLANKLAEWLKTHYMFPGVIHGDPVFTNILVTSNNAIKFIDPRGSINREPTIYGDILYDYAKIYQSLVGYDAILLGKDQPDNIQEHIKLVAEWVHDHYGLTAAQSLPKLTGILLLSLLPLHEPHNRPRFMELAQRVCTSI